MYNYRRKELNKRLGSLKSPKVRFWGKVFKIFIGTRSRESAYSWLRRVEPEHLGARGRDWRLTMKDARNVLRIIGMILLGVFVFAVVLPLALKVVGITLGIIISLAVLLIKVAVTLAIGYLVLVGIRALLR